MKTVFFGVVLVLGLEACIIGTQPKKEQGSCPAHFAIESPSTGDIEYWECSSIEGRCSCAP